MVRVTSTPLTGSVQIVFSGIFPGARKNQRGEKIGIIRSPFFLHAMLSPGKALVGGKDDYGVFQLVGFFSEAVEHSDPTPSSRDRERPVIFFYRSVIRSQSGSPLFIFFPTRQVFEVLRSWSGGGQRYPTGTRASGASSSSPSVRSIGPLGCRGRGLQGSRAKGTTALG